MYLERVAQECQVGQLRCGPAQVHDRRQAAAAVVCPLLACFVWYQLQVQAYLSVKTHDLKI